MPIDKDAIEARIIDLRAKRERALQTAFVLDGAIQDCEYWLGVVFQENKPAEPTEAPID